MRLRTKSTLAAAGAVAAWTLWRRAKAAPWPDFFGRVVFITGGSRGLGLVLAHEFVARGARVALCARDADELERARRDLGASAGRIEAFQCDVTRYADIAEAMTKTLDRFGRIDVLVNNAGVMTVGPERSLMVKDFTEAMNVHFWGPLNGVLAVLPIFRRLRGGRIVNIASIGGKIAVPHMLPYDASKFALVGLSEGLRAELLRERIAVTTVCPGPMRTGSAINAFFKSRHRKEFTLFSLAAGLPLLSNDADRAARRIVEACRRGKAEIVVGAPAKAAAIASGLFPGLMTDALAAVDALMPTLGGIGMRRRKGKESKSPLAPSLLTRLNDRAAAKNNEL